MKALLNFYLLARPDFFEQVFFGVLSLFYLVAFSYFAYSSKSYRHLSNIRLTPDFLTV